MNIHWKTIKSRKKWDFMGIYGKTFYAPENKFKIFVWKTLYVVFKINYVHRYRKIFRKPMTQKT